MTLGLLIFAATSTLIAVHRLPSVHLSRPAARAERRGVRIGFGEYAKIGVTLLTLAWAWRCGR